MSEVEMPLASGGAEDRVLRVTAVLFAVAACVFGLLDAPTIARQTRGPSVGWEVPALVGTLVAPLVLGGLAGPVRARAAHLRAVAESIAGAYLLALATLPLLPAADGTAADGPWLLQLTAIGTTAGALVLPPPAIISDLVLTTGLVVFDRIATARSPLTTIAVQDGLYNLLFSAVFAALAAGALAAARAVDATAAATRAAVVTAHHEQARATERARVNAVVHDHILSTLLVAGRSMQPSPAAARDAADALTRLEQLDDDERAEATIDRAGLIDRVRGLVTRTAPQALVTVDGEQGEMHLPSSVSEVLLGAVSEALRNARRHAGAGASITLRIRCESEAIEVSVVDDGVGFDRRHVPVTRLGLAVSVTARVVAVGGTVEIGTRPGHGTAIQIRWAAP